MLAMLVIVLACFYRLEPAQRVLASSGSALTSISLTDQNGQALKYDTTPTFEQDPTYDSYYIQIYEDTTAIRIVAAANGDDFIQLTLDGDDVGTARQGSVDEMEPVTLDSKLLKITVSKSIGEPSVYNFHLIPSMRGAGTETNPYLIGAPQQLRRIGVNNYNNYNMYDGFKNYKLVSDIDMTAYLGPDGEGYDAGNGWKPIPDLYGTFDGNGKTISGLRINRSDATYVGLFATISSGTVKNLTLAIDEVNGSQYAGGLAGRFGSGSSSARIEDVKVSGSVISTGDSPVGGVIGTVQGGTLDRVEFSGNVEGNSIVGGMVGNMVNATLSGSSVNANVSGQDFTGGLVGFIPGNGQISASSASGSVTGTSKQIGGLVGYSSNTQYADVSSTASVQGATQTGGLIGLSNNDTLHRAWATGAVNGTNQVGGLIGHATSNHTITKSFATGNVTGGNQVGGLIGDVSSGTNMYTDVYATGSVAGGDHVGGLVGKNGTPANRTTIANAYAAGAVHSSTGNHVGGLIGGTDYDMSMTSSYWDKETTGQLTSAGGAGAEARLTAEMQGSTENYVGWDFANVWFNQALQYPILKWAIPNHSPTDITLSSESIAENADAGTTVGQLGAVDPDENDTFVFALVDGEGSDDNARFSIEDSALKTAESFDYETKASFSLRVRVTDAGGEQFEKSFTIAVTDLNEPLTVLTLSANEIAENAAAGTMIGTLSAGIADAGETLTYSLTADAPDNAYFHVSGNTLLSNAVFDYETKSVYSIKVSVTDSVYDYEKSFSIAVTDLTESPSELMISATDIPENAPLGTVIGTFSAVNPNPGSGNVYSFAPGSGDEDNASFTLDGNMLKANAMFDYETKNVYKIRIGVADSVYGPVYGVSKPFTIQIVNVNEAPTALNLSADSVEENKPAGTMVGSFSAQDPDGDGTAFTYSLANGPGGEDNASFIVDGALLRTAATFDYETKSSYRIHVQVSDGELHYSKPFVIQVTNVHEYTATTTTVTASPNPSTEGSLVTLTALVTGAGGAGTPTGTVSFMDGATPLGTATLTGGYASIGTMALAAGAPTITAEYGGDSSYSGSSGTTVVTVQAAPTYSIGAIADQTAEALIQGYASSSIETKTIHITNTGTATLTNLSASLSGAQADAFAISALPSTLNGGATTTLTVQAIEGLPAGTYAAAVTVSAWNTPSVTFTVTQVVNLPDAPANPQNLTAVGGDKQVALYWDTVVGAVYYSLYMSTTSGQFGRDPVAEITDTAHTVRHLTNGITYSFIVKAGNAGGLSVSSNQAEAIPAAVPAAPTNVTAVAGDGQATVAFIASADDGGSPITGYKVTASPGSRVVTGAASPITVTGLSNGTSYTFTVKAINRIGSGAASMASNAVVPHADDSDIGDNNSSGGNANRTPEQPAMQDPAAAGFDVLVNGKAERAGTATTATIDGQTVTIVAVDQQKLEEKLLAEGQGAVVTIPVYTKANVVIGELNGQMVRSMEEHQSVLNIRTDRATYTLPAEQINIDFVTSQLGGSVALQDIHIRIQIAEPTADTMQVVERAAEEGAFTLVVAPLQFTVQATYEGRTIDISEFTAYVERTVAIPEGVDPDKITTAVVVDRDGTVRHVPTKVVQKDGSYYAVINSLTNSTYSLVWHPVEFQDMVGHWAKTAVNNMGSRMVIEGSGDGRFGPDAAVTRAEFAAILVRGLGIRPEAGAAPFPDVPESAWYSSAIRTAHSYRLISGFEDSLFRPNDRMTREQAVVMLSRAMAITKLEAEVPATAEDVLSPYSDAADVSEWAASSMAEVVRAGLVSGSGGDLLMPQAWITRAEVAAILERLLAKSGLI